MSSNRDYRSNAEDCLRKARTAENDGEKPFWINLAQSWLQLAEQSAQSDDEPEARGSRVGSDSH